MSKEQKIKITHKYKCQICGKPATCNIQDCGFVKYSIAPDGEMELEDEWGEGDSTNDLFCDDCIDE